MTISWRSFGVAAALWAAPPALAGQDTTATSQDTAATPAPNVVPVAEVPTRATALSDSLRGALRSLAGDGRLASLDSSLGSLPDSLGTVRARLDATRLDVLGLRRLDDRLVRWRAVEQRLNGWATQLTTLAEADAASATVLGALRERWERTDSALAAETVPEGVRSQVENLIRRMDRVRAALQAHEQSVLDLQATVADLRSVTGDAIATIKQARGVARRRVFVRNEPPLWSAILGASGDRTITSVGTEALVEDVLTFVAEEQDRLWFELVILVALVALSVTLRRRMGARYPVEVPDGVRRALKRPVAAAVLVTMVFAAALFDRVTGRVSDILVLVAALAVLRLTPVYLGKSLVRPTTWLVLLVVFDQLAALFLVEPLAVRLVSLLVAIAAAGTLAVLRTRVVADVTMWTGTWAGLTRLAMLLAVAAAGANVIGFTNLAGLLLTGTLISFLVTLVVMMVVVTLEGIVAGASNLKLIGTIPGFRLHQAVATARALQLLRLGVAALWFLTVLRAFGMDDIVLQWLRILWAAAVTIGSWTLSVGSVVLFFLSMWLALAVGRGVRAVLRDDILPRMHLARGLPNTIATLTFYAIVVLGFLFAVGAAGVDLGALAIVAGALSVGIGFGLQNVVNNFISGLILMFERPIQIGDVIQLDDLIGKVTDIGIRASMVRTFEGAEVIIPNGELISGRVVNWTLSDRRRRIDLPVGVAYGTPPEQVLDLLVKAAESQPSVIAEPKPVALFIGFGESSLDFELRTWTDDFVNWRIVASDVAVAVNKALAQAGIEIPFPQRDLHVRSVDPAVGRLVGGKVKK